MDVRGSVCERSERLAIGQVSHRGGAVTSSMMDDDDDDDDIKKSRRRRPVLNRLFQGATFVGWTNCVSTRGPIMAYGP